MTRPPQLLTDIFRADTKADAAIAPRIAAAIGRLRDARDPIRAARSDGERVAGGGDRRDPVAELAEQHVDHGDHISDTLRRLDQLIMRRHDISIEIAHIVNEWAPNTRKSGQPTMYCTNHLDHGHEVLREGRYQLCAWCRYVKARWKQLPNAELIRLHSHTARISEATYRRILGRTAA